MTAIYEICKDAILKSTEFSTEANDLIITMLEENNDSFTAATALIYNSRYVQLNKNQRLRLLKLALSGSNKEKNMILSNYKYINKARKYELDYLAENANHKDIQYAFELYPNDYKQSLLHKCKSDKLLSIFTIIQLENN